MAGLLDLAGSGTPAELEELAQRMAGTLRHRGPDQQTAWADEHGAVAFGHTRLAIIDLTDAGAQPMRSGCGRWTLAFNGELYGVPPLRARLEAAGRSFRGRSDTEVLVEALGAWGIDDTLAAIEGMYAFAAWDHQERVLHLARDPLGEKPLYYGVGAGQLLFGSELKALVAHPGFNPTVDPAAVAELLRRSFIPSPMTIYRGVHKLRPGTVLSVAADHRGALPVPRAHYDYAEAVRGAVADRWDPPPAELADHLDELLRGSVAARTASDVPLGAFLSGGIDSSLVVALLQAQATQPVRTFTVDVGAAAGSEAAKAAAVAGHLGTDHTTIRLSEADALEVVPRLAEIYDEPFADPSGIPTYLVARETRRHVTVAMSGDGGDELFGGYNRYTLGAAAWPRLQRLPMTVRRGVARAITAVPPQGFDRAAAGVASVTRRPGLPRAGDKLHRLADILPAADPDDLYERAAWYWRDTDRLAGATSGPSRPPELTGLGPVERAMLRDGLTVLPDQMLAKVDRASMASSLEVRVPLLAPTAAALAWRLPIERKVLGGSGKLPLRAVLARYLPQELIDQPKQGFDPPLAAWLRGPLRPWADDLLSTAALRSVGLLDPAPVRRAWAEHRLGRRNHDYRLWSILMLQAWGERSPERTT